jgi:hypothetical protein
VDCSGSHLQTPEMKEAIEKEILQSCWFLAVEWSKRRRLQREGSGSLRPRNEVRRLKHRPAESEAYCGIQQRCLIQTRTICFFIRLQRNARNGQP